MSFKLAAFGLAACLATAGCATKSAYISGQYVSPLQFQSYSCSQVTEEALRISERSALAFKVQNAKARNDAVAAGVAMALFWPAAFFVGGNDANASEVARLKGTMDALEAASIQKHCGLEFVRAPLPKSL
ncbi:hypothetical protein CLG85_015950 [Yangia mangrovi]|uniref:Lipoprotein n=1 Tax=Alloyangia mangrovi TaxID=1779329 RepID=A0A2A3JT00_9RHOB|nr:hypothetical protein [Alloyangia mangrovi]MCA0939509.1 hypothetical protein [Alloyangia pacifica]MCA0943470.1 hypothetical protein [Alloyangia pacifica]MCT4371729.1 hypothetical protein [Alloyangia mangrovi]